MNKAILDRVLQAEIYVNPSDSQLRAAHLILGYNPISRAFQAPSCVIKAKDPRLRRISVAYERFIVPQGVPLPRYAQLTEPLPVASLVEAAPSSLPVRQVEEEEETEREGEGVVDLTLATDDYEVFNQSTPSPDTPEDMGIQRKPQCSLQELLESQLGRGEAGRSSQPKLPPPPPKSPPRAPQPSLPFRVEQPDPKRRREPKGKEVVKTGRTRSSSEEEAPRPLKQLKNQSGPQSRTGKGRGSTA